MKEFFKPKSPLQRLGLIISIFCFLYFVLGVLSWANNYSYRPLLDTIFDRKSGPTFSLALISGTVLFLGIVDAIGRWIFTGNFFHPDRIYNFKELLNKTTLIIFSAVFCLILFTVFLANIDNIDQGHIQAIGKTLGAGLAAGIFALILKIKQK